MTPGWYVGIVGERIYVARLSPRLSFGGKGMSPRRRQRVLPENHHPNFVPRTVKVHVGIAWKFRNTRNTNNSKTHAVIENPDAPPHPVRDDYTGFVSWSAPWLMVCNGEPADERCTGWAEEVACIDCRRKLSEVAGASASR